MAYDFSQLDTKVNSTVEWLRGEFQGLRTGRASAGLLDGVQVNAYGTRTPLNQIASISVEDARSLRIVPWDAGLVKEVEKAITDADLGVGVGSDAAGVRVTFPELTTERRGEFVKMAKEKLEEARTTIRSARDDTWNAIQKMEKDGEMSEDEKFTAKDEMQKKVDSGNNEMEALFSAKESEILEK